jgi:hypothetical protein
MNKETLSLKTPFGNLRKVVCFIKNHVEVSPKPFYPCCTLGIVGNPSMGGA